MGGYGSGRRWSRKDTVEESLTLDAQDFGRWGKLFAGAGGTVNWRDSVTKEPTGWISYSVEEDYGDRMVVRLRYGVGSGEERRSLDYTIPLEVVPAQVGGKHVYLYCILFQGGRRCGNRVRKLYLPPGATYFGCRECHDLTYRSCQESDSRFSRFRKNPALIAAALKNPRQMPHWLLLGVLKAAMKE